MKPETLVKAKIMLTDVLLRGATYREAGEPYGLSRSTVERQVKALVLTVVRAHGVPGLDEDALISLARLRKARSALLEAVQKLEHAPGIPRRTHLTAEDVAEGAHRIRARSENASRDVALMYVACSTGAKPIEIARFVVSDYLNADGTVREISAMRAEAAVQGRARPLYFASERTCGALDAYLLERVRCHLGVGANPLYRGLDPDSALFLTEDGRPFGLRARGAHDPRLTCPLMIATLREIFKRAGWPGVSAQRTRRLLAQRLFDKRADAQQLGELLGLSDKRSVRRLLERDRQPLETLVRDLV